MKTSTIGAALLPLACAAFAVAAGALPSPQVLRIDSGRADRGLAVTSDAAGNAYVAGAIERRSEPSEFSVVKYDSRGARLWEAHHAGSIGGPRGEARAVAVDGAGNVFAGGYLLTSVGLASTFNAALVKFNADGFEQWSVRLGVGSVAAVVVDAAGNAYVGGTVSGKGPDWILRKYSTNGALLWEQRYDGTLGYNDSLTALALDPAGNVLATGWTDSSDSERGATDIATVKYDPQGNALWKRLFTSTAASDEKPWGLALDAAGTAYVTGLASSDSSGEVPVTAVTLAYDAQGTLRFAREFGGQAVATGAAGELVVAGQAAAQGAAGTTCPAPTHVTRLDSAGAELWTTCLAGAIANVAIGRDGRIFVAGGTDGFNLDYQTLELDAAGRIVARHVFDGTAGQRDAAQNAHLDGFGNLYVTGVSFASAVSISADMVTLKFAAGGAPPGGVPAAPGGLGATADARSVTLRWLDNSSDEDGLRIERCQGADCTGFAQIAQLASDATSFVDGGRRPNTRYRYRVRAFNAAGNSAYSNIVGVQTARR